jgi:hypothetical protein
VLVRGRKQKRGQASFLASARVTLSNESRVEREKGSGVVSMLYATN